MDFGDLVSISVPQQKVRFVFDRNPKTNASAEVLYSFLTETSGWEGASYLDSITFASRSEVGIQAADILAREAMKHADNLFIGPKRRPVRKSMKPFSATLETTGRYKFRWFSREYFENTDEK
ncbi:MAG TPA: hypothetical protein VMT62_16175 [Syntrophorhabdaceae bacterium]|nr:hypothetical protein [Syntrophorhabdaceae bacterium]